MAEVPGRRLQQAEDGVAIAQAMSEPPDELRTLLVQFLGD
jgi:hypothetical protein